MRWTWGGALLAVALGGCAHEESASVETATPVAEAPQMTEPPKVEQQEGMVLREQGKYQTPKGSYSAEQGEYLQPQGIYGEKGKLITEGQVMQEGTYGTFVKPEGTSQQPTGLRTEPSGTFYKPFGSDEIGDERQPVAGRDAPKMFFFVRDKAGHTWGLTNVVVIKAAEQKLSDQGCEIGDVDGKADEQFGKGLMKCQSKLGLQPTGVIDQQSAERLGLDWPSLQEPAHRHDKSQP